MYGIEREKKSKPAELRREAPMQKAGLMKMQNRRGKRPFRCSRKKQTAASIFRGGSTVSERVVFWYRDKQRSRYRLFFHRAIRKCQKRLVASKRKSYVDQRYFFVQVGIVEVAKEVEDPVDLEMLMLSPVPARGEEGKKKNRCLLWMSVPAKMDSSNERMRTVILQSRLQRRRRLRAAQSRLGVTEARREPPYHRLLTGCCILAGDTDCGGLDMEMPVAGLMMGMAFRARVAAGWCIFMVDC
jgi:hypothetical protein